MRRDRFSAAGGALALAVGAAVAYGAPAAVVVAVCAAPALFAMIRIGRRFGLQQGDDLLYEQEEVPDTLPREVYAKRIMEQFWDRMHAEQEQKARVFLILIAIVAVIYLMAVIKTGRFPPY